jgi:hypothetical protein
LTKLLPLAGFEGAIRPEIAGSTSLRKLESPPGPKPEENQGHFSRVARSNEGAFCSDERVLLGLIGIPGAGRSSYFSFKEAGVIS